MYSCVQSNQAWGYSYQSLRVRDVGLSDGVLSAGFAMFMELNRRICGLWKWYKVKAKWIRPHLGRISGKWLELGEDKIVESLVRRFLGRLGWSSEGLFAWELFFNRGVGHLWDWDEVGASALPFKIIGTVYIDVDVRIFWTHPLKMKRMWEKCWYLYSGWV